MKDGNELKQKLVGVGKAPPIRAAETPAKPSVVRAAETPAKPSVVRPIEERETIEIERRGLAEIYIVRAAPYTDRATLPSSQSTAGRPAAIERTAPNDSNGNSPPGLSAAPGGALAHTEASQISAESAQQAGSRKLTKKQAEVAETARKLYPDPKVLDTMSTLAITDEVNEDWKRRGKKGNLATDKTVATALNREPRHKPRRKPRRNV